MLILEFFTFLNNLKLYHWSTTSYARHKASDDCFSKLQNLVDQFVETYIGKYGRSQLSSVEGKKLDVHIYNDQEAKKLLKHMVQYLTGLKLDAKLDSDLITIRDEMLGSLNQTLYLFSLDK